MPFVSVAPEIVTYCPVVRLAVDGTVTVTFADVAIEMGGIDKIVPVEKITSIIMDIVKERG